MSETGPDLFEEWEGSQRVTVVRVEVRPVVAAAGCRRHNRSA
jgi:hypothetical protein